ncbi:hypothetical protein [Candidatus Tisiphia endosymbiont of Hybos culiciformis]|uniref:hypothetical protein n=1 Tax=Candidatus Tisiphia endosymbiont of Hybos culiciformis TaxID=3139331 RepID=UPI003CCB1971
MIKNITIVSCHSREGGNLDTCFRRYDTKFVSPNSIGFTIIKKLLKLVRQYVWVGIKNLFNIEVKNFYLEVSLI